MKAIYYYELLILLNRFFFQLIVWFSADPVTTQHFQGIHYDLEEQMVIVNIPKAPAREDSKFESAQESCVHTRTRITRFPPEETQVATSCTARETADTSETHHRSNPHHMGNQRNSGRQQQRGRRRGQRLRVASTKLAPRHRHCTSTATSAFSSSSSSSTSSCRINTNTGRNSLCGRE